MHMIGIIAGVVRILLEEVYRANSLCCSRGRKYSAFLLFRADGWVVASLTNVADVM